MFPENGHRVGVIIGTGPSLTQEQIDQVAHLPKFGCNRAYEFDLDVLLACNWQFWDHYWPQIKDLRCDKWTPRRESAKTYGINYIEERWADGISTDPTYIHAHHGSGPQILNLAYHYGVRTFILIGWDMRYPDKVNNREYKGRRHYFGEYPAELQHWPRTGDNGELAGLIREMETIKPDDYGIDIINCTPGSAMTCFKSRSLSESLADLML